MSEETDSVRGARRTRATAVRRKAAAVTTAVLTGILVACAPPVSHDHSLTPIPQAPAQQGDLSPGDPITIGNSDGSYNHCTAGVTVNAQGEQGILTAGHCGSAGDPVFIQGRGGRWVQVSTVQRSTYNPNTGIDAAFIPLAGSTSQHVRSASVASSSGLTRGTKVCAAGVTSGYRCGSVLTVAANRIIADFPSQHGDSGGPVWAGDRVIGIVRAIPDEEPDETVVFPIGAALRTVGVS